MFGGYSNEKQQQHKKYLSLCCFLNSSFQKTKIMEKHVKILWNLNEEAYKYMGTNSKF